MGTTTLLCPLLLWAGAALSLPRWGGDVFFHHPVWVVLPSLLGGAAPHLLSWGEVVILSIPFSGGDAFLPRSLEMVLHTALSLCLVLCSMSCIVLGSDPVPCDTLKTVRYFEKQRKTLGVCSFGTWRSALSTWHSEFCYVLRAECSLSTWHSLF